MNLRNFRERLLFFGGIDRMIQHEVFLIINHITKQIFLTTDKGFGVGVLITLE